MALSQPRTVSHSEALASRSPLLPKFQTAADESPDINYSAAMESDHSRDLYLQGAAAVGQIARLLEELCAEVDGEEIIDNLGDAQFEDGWISQSLPYDKRCHIEAWAHAVELADGSGDDDGILDTDDADETGEQIYLRSPFVVVDVVDSEVPENLDSCIRNEDGRAKTPRSVLGRPSMTKSPKHTSENVDFDLVQRMKSLIARLDKLEVDIDEFSKDTCDALARLDLELAADMDNGVDVDGDIDPQLDFALRVFGFRLGPTHKEAASSLPILEASTTTTTSDDPPATLREFEVEGRPRGPVKGLGCIRSHV